MKINPYVFQAVFADEFSDLAFRLARVQVMFGSCAAFRYSVHCKKRLATFPSPAGYSRQGEFGK